MLVTLLTILPTGASAQGASSVTLSLTSSAFAEGGEIPTRYTCEGEDVSPPLAWSQAPSGTRSLALIVDDPDAPDPKAPKMTWVHWVLYNLPPTAGQLLEAVESTALPAGTGAGLNDWQQPGYGGPCPPQGDKPHHYIFTVYAVDEDKLQFAKDHNVSAAVVGFELHFHSKAKASLTATYGR